MIIALLVLNLLAGFVFGFFASGKGTETDKLRSIFGMIYLVFIVASLIVFIIRGYWIGLLWLVIIFFVIPRIGSMLMKKWLLKRGYTRDML